MKKMLAIALILSLSATVYAVQSASWEINNPDGWRKGELQGAILSADGSLTMGATYTKIALPSRPITDEDAGLWCSATVNNRVYFGSAKGIIYSLNRKEGKLEEVFNTGELLVTTMIDSKGEIYAGTIPNGKIFKLDKAGKGALFCALPENAKYVWQLCFDGDNNLYAATGPEGKIYKIDNTGKAEVFYDTKKKNVLSLIFNGKDYFYAGTDSPGIVYRISLKGRPEIVADFGDMEIKSLVYSPAKNEPDPTDPDGSSGRGPGTGGTASGELFIGANKGIQVAPQEFLGLIKQSAQKAAVTPPVPGQTPKDASPNDTKPTPPKETPKHDRKTPPGHETPPPADQDHGDHHPPAPPAPDHKSARPNAESGQVDNPANRDKSTPPERKSQDSMPSDDDEVIEEAPVPMQDDDNEEEPPPMPTPPPVPATPAPAGPSETVSAPPPPEAPRPPVHCVIYKLSNPPERPNGRAGSFIKEVIALNDCYITEMKLNADGVLIAGTDNSGRIYYVFQSGKFFIPYDLDAGQVLTLVMDKDNQLYAAGTGKKAAVYLARTDLSLKAEFTAEVWDARFPSKWGNFSFKGQGNLMLQVQSGNTAKPDETWSDWSNPL